VASYVPRESSDEVFLPPSFSILTWLTGNMSWLHLITHNLPWFIRTPAVALLGSECYTNLIYNVQLDHIYCLKYGISKFLSLAIVFGSGIVKVPQIIKILQSRSARGLSLAGFLLDSLGLVIIVCYNHRHDFPFSTYGSAQVFTFFKRKKQNNLLFKITFLLYPLSKTPNGKFCKKKQS